MHLSASSVNVDVEVNGANVAAASNLVYDLISAKKLNI